MFSEQLRVAAARKTRAPAAAEHDHDISLIVLLYFTTSNSQNLFFVFLPRVAGIRSVGKLTLFLFSSCGGYARELKLAALAETDERPHSQI